ncbi:PREDICTED: multidrug resistance-associated protein 4-like [Bison bison bison]|uniref:Multidrug resistance-associated protein 4-like n=1 Tax=Bison bison bison TaxID=43346 RepID=A0A6P3GT22_BISBB|nr:PREDICTED: multidrug resistance-associated protein 4-like [Bison bison bison]
MVAVIPWIAIPVIPLGIAFFFLQRYFSETSRDIKRLECATRSPVFSHLASSLRGVWTIRAYKAEQSFQKLFDAHQDLHSEAWFLLLTTSRWLAVYLDVICAIFVTVVAFVSLILADALTPGQVGLVLSLALTLTGMFQWCVRQRTEVENLMVSVERVMGYLDLEKEAPWEYKDRPPPPWMVYSLTLVGNVGIVSLIRLDPHLHTPMYFFLSNLAFVDFCYSSSIAPKFPETLLSKHRSISLYALMAYDRYVAICDPLLYMVIMSQKVCMQLVAGPY